MSMPSVEEQIKAETNRKELFGLTTSELTEQVVSMNQPQYRGKQLSDWLYKKGAVSFSQMTDLPANFRQDLESNCTLTRSKIAAVSGSRDGTIKYLLELGDGQQIESVLLPYPDRVTVCVSTQVGCAAGCTFCATADSGFIRNLSAGEIIDQVLTLQSESGRRVTNVVYMGMGEPLLNYDAVLSSVRILNKEVGVSNRKITISTVGITPRIRQLQTENLPITLAVSLHAPDDELRNIMIPFSEKYRLSDLLAACREYARNTGRRVTYEYLLIAGLNDGPEQARRLASRIGGSLANVNLIPCNPVPGKGYKRPTAAAVTAFRNILEQAGIETNQRFERGHSVSAACGQLRAGHR